MIVEIFLIFVIFLCFLGRRNKVVYFMMSMFMFAFIVFTTFNADYHAYLSRYLDATRVSNILSTDSAFGILMFICRRLDLSYAGFLAVIAVIGLVIIGVSLYKNSEFPCIQLVVYFMLFFDVHMIQIRSFIAEWILIAAVFYYISEKATTKKYVFLVLIASLFHLSSIFYLAMIIPKVVKSRRSMIVTTVALGIMYPIVYQLMLVFNIANSQMKLEHYAAQSGDRFGIKSVIFIALLIFMTLYIKWIANRTERAGDIALAYRYDLIYKFSFVSWFSIAMIVLYSNNYYRINRPIIVVAAICAVEHFLAKRLDYQKRVILAAALCILVFVVREMLAHTWLYAMGNNSLFSDLI